MRIALAPLFVASLVTPAFAVAAPAPATSVAAAKQGLETARANLAAAMKKVEADAPQTSDLDAAHEALNAVKDAIDAGSSQEPNDLDYAKSALAARKELREKRDLVDARRAKVHIFNHRRTIDTALTAMKEKAKLVEPKEPSSADFEAVRAAIAEVKAAAAPARQFGPQDASFASYLADLDAQVSKLEKSTDDKWALLEGDKHRAKVEEARLAFTQAMSGLSASSTDEQFGEADKAGKLLAQRLDEGKVLESKDKNYGPYAAKTRSELVTAKKKSDELWSQTGFTRLKAEIEPSAKDLQAALKIVRMKRPSDDQLAEARTIAIVVKKLLEKFQPEAERSAQFGEYVATVKASLAEVEGNLQLKALDIAQKDFRNALVKLDRKAPSDDDFAVANSSMLVLEKTLEPMNARDPLLIQPVADARAWLKDGKNTITKRRTELDVAAQKEKVEAVRNTASTLLGNFAKPETAEPQVKETEDALKGIITALDAGVELTKRDREYAAYDREVRKRVDEGHNKIAAKRLQLTAMGAKADLAAALADLKAKIETARTPASTDADLDAVMKAMDSINSQLEAKAQLETQNANYAAAAERGRLELMKRMETAEIARQERDAKKRTIDAFAPALAAADAAAASSDLRVQKSNYEKALAGFKTCKEEGAKILEGTPQFGRLQGMVQNLPSTLKDVVSQCGQRADATAPLIKPLAALIAFEDGPKKAYEAAVALLSKGKKQEALAQFDECTATGVTLGVRNPDMKEKSFTVAGQQMTLSELNKTCSTKSKELLGKK